MTLRTCGDCIHWRSPASTNPDPKKPNYGQCQMLVGHPRSRRVMPEHEVEHEHQWAADPFRTTAAFNACRGWAPADRTKARPELQLVKGGRR